MSPIFLLSLLGGSLSGAFVWEVTPVSLLQLVALEVWHPPESEVESCHAEGDRSDGTDVFDGRATTASSSGNRGPQPIDSPLNRPCDI
jgi:hypothetical protein